MIKLITLILTITIANADIFPFLLPDEGSLLKHHLQSLLKNSQEEIIIITPSMHYPSLDKSILHSISSGGHVTLIVSKLVKDPLRLVTYKGVTLKTHTSRMLTDTLILVDNTQVCHLPGSLNEESLGENVSSVWCSDEPTLILTTKKQISKLIRRSRSYLE